MVVDGTDGQSDACLVLTIPIDRCSLQLGDITDLQYFLYKEDTARIAALGVTSHSFSYVSAERVNSRPATYVD